MAKHRHSYHVSCWNGGNVTFRCKCGEQVERKMTREERSKFREQMSLGRFIKPENDIHRVWHSFSKKFITRVNGKDEFNDCPVAELGDKVIRWAKKFPKDVKIVGCDDSYFSCSDLVLIEHRTARKYMGTSVVFIPQCSGDPPAQFFLYPGHLDDLINALKTIKKEAALRKRLETADSKANGHWWNARAPEPNCSVTRPKHAKGQ